MRHTATKARAALVAFPIEAEGFFVQEPAGSARIIGPEQAHQEAA